MENINLENESVETNITKEKEVINEVEVIKPKHVVEGVTDTNKQGSNTNKNRQKNNKKFDNTNNKNMYNKNWDKPSDLDKESVTTNQNTILGAKIKLASNASYVREILDNNKGSKDIKPEDINLMFAIKDLPPEMRKGVNLMSYAPDWSKEDPFEGIPVEEALKLKRDYYSVTGNYGDFLPDETSLFMYRSPVETVNLDLEQVAMLIEKGFEVKNKRTGDLVTKKNYKLYIKLWSKDKDLILVTARQRRGKED